MSEAHPGAEAPERRVRVLPDDLANQIAAGEVVERPASVIKELVENAIDAGARRVSIDIESGGVVLARVADDGGGMGRDDARLSVLRHATSKIARIDDLRRIASFGFRGEALPSIASVSRFSLRTRRRDEDEGTEVRVDGGGAAVVAPCGCAAGTVVEVRELFYNVPARLKFLRAVGTESAHVTEVALAAALSAPLVTVVLARDGKRVKEWLREGGREERVRATLVGEELAACRGQRGPLTVEAFVSRPERARNGATALSVFVNGRHVKDRQLARAVANAYGSVLEPGRFPVGVVYLDLPHELVDVNVHPQKAEVRFADGRAVADALFRVITDELTRAFNLPAVGAGGWGKKQKLFDEGSQPAINTWSWTSAPTPAGEVAPALAPGGEVAPAPAPDPWGLAPDAPPANALTSNDVVPVPYVTPAMAILTAAETVATGTRVPEPPASAPRGGFQTLRFVAQVRRTFLVCEAADGLYIVDQHAAAERVTFDRLRRAFQAREVATQRLLFPVIVEVSAAEAALVEEAQDEMARAGVEVRPAGPTSVAVHAVPRLLARASPERLVRDIVGELGRGGERAFSGAIDLALATMACHGSLRAGDPIAPEEATALLGALDAVDFGGHCPHGRPVVTSIRWAELERNVGRR